MDTVTRTVTAQPRTDLHPYAIAVDTMLHRVYVSNTFSKQLTVIDGATTPRNRFRWVRRMPFYAIPPGTGFT